MVKMKLTQPSWSNGLFPFFYIYKCNDDGGDFMWIGRMGIFLLKSNASWATLQLTLFVVPFPKIDFFSLAIEPIFYSFTVFFSDTDSGLTSFPSTLRTQRSKSAGCGNRNPTRNPPLHPRSPWKWSSTRTKSSETMKTTPKQKPFGLFSTLFWELLMLINVILRLFVFQT